MNAIWVKSSLSFSNGNCVEVGAARRRDSVFATAGIPGGPVLMFTPGQWDAFVGGARGRGIRQAHGLIGGGPGAARSLAARSSGWSPSTRVRDLPKPSNSPFRTPPRKACHSSGVNVRTGPPESLLLRTPISPPGRLATSTQLPLA